VVAGEQDPLEFLLAQAVGDMAEAGSTAVLIVPITQEGLTLEAVQGIADLPVGSTEGTAAGLGLTNQLDRFLPVGGTRQPSTSSEQKASHRFLITSRCRLRQGLLFTLQLITAPKPSLRKDDLPPNHGKHLPLIRGRNIHQ